MLLPACCDLPIITGQDMLKVAVIGSGMMVDMDCCSWLAGLDFDPFLATSDAAAGDFCWCRFDGRDAAAFYGLMVECEGTRIPSLCEESWMRVFGKDFGMLVHAAEVAWPSCAILNPDDTVHLPGGVFVSFKLNPLPVFKSS
ncbi:hypothetical protein Nepgr_022916 [Nepenthes gracilis]|uniref:Uncharacterized protein n=1 Tax=Nepenthes gracilis TaxID=150966 RepID=A0AAD3XYJ3_NEPGR|nr:hypothetical protein Nepgr_022916 [Nepenthes gracilis]